MLFISTWGTIIYIWHNILVWSLNIQFQWDINIIQVISLLLKSKIHCLENSHIKIKNFIMLKTYLLLYRLQNTDSHSSYDNQLAISLLDKQKWTDLPTRSWNGLVIL